MDPFGTPLGATPMDGASAFVVWAPSADRVDVKVVSPRERTALLEPGDRGYHSGTVEGVGPGDRYRFVLDGDPELADPASRSQPDGVHGPSRIVDPGAFAWTDGGWTAPPLGEHVIYELHVGTFTPAGTFEGVARRLDALAELGVSAIELMPVAEFPGRRNWGYDGVFPFAPQSTYGGPAGLRRLVDACHGRGLAVILDVVFNHVGPEGNVLGRFGPYFTDRYRTPWGHAVNFDGPGSDEVRRFFAEDALWWLEAYHIDGLRLDAIHAIVDQTARPFLQELSEAVATRAEELGRRLILIGETPENDARVVTPRELGGFGLDALWSEGFHHAVHALVTGERGGYYEDYGELEQVARAMAEGWVFAGQYSRFWGRRHGSSPRPIPPDRFVVYAQNHDQVGNRALGERLGALTGFEQQKLVAAVLLLSPFVPLLFMGQEYGETAPFLYFVDHSDPELIEAVRRGRREELAGLDRPEDPPDPQDERTFLRSRLDPGLRERQPHRALEVLYRELVRLRRAHPALAASTKDGLETWAESGTGLLYLRRRAERDEALALFHFGEEAAEARLPAGTWRRAIDSTDVRWGGRGGQVPELVAGEREPVPMVPAGFVLFLREDEGGVG
ncbi:MAG TPA: malto-oligosyltrehalose trehalohydrolase [Actinomycetota bacterium]|nr:malto-oligosyltrehalose trehalohydrolase [Actinomycetota bacterium]